MSCFILSIYIDLKKLVKKSEIKSYKTFNLAISEENIIPFSFFNWIVISLEDYNKNADEILLHEEMHIRKGHNIETTFLQLFVILQWFNPTAWLLTKDLCEVHEYESDNAVIDSGFKISNIIS